MDLVRNEVIRRSQVIDDARGRTVTLTRHNYGYQLLDEYTYPKPQVRMVLFFKTLMEAWKRFDAMTPGKEWREDVLG